MAEANGCGDALWRRLHPDSPGKPPSWTGATLFGRQKYFNNKILKRNEVNKWNC